MDGRRRRWCPPSPLLPRHECVLRQHAPLRSCNPARPPPTPATTPSETPPQGNVRSRTAAVACAAALSHWLFIVRLALGLDGTALALLVAQLTSTLLLGSYVVLCNAGWA